ncbi:GntR family transcriptional regulator [Pseudonocardia spinosispora]|uniref:GntR family transcriptional regulator n=1 Tax=Pseudonocardia spinosispora TaxID=103441 RepID=UPI003CCC007D
MSKVHGKQARLVEELAGRIRSGGLAHGERLPGENRLAERYSVSRGTVRNALAELQRRELIVTETGVGSFVTFDGVQLDQNSGWARALAGSDVTARLLSIESGGDAAVTARYGPVVTVRRLRSTASGTPVSLETAALPAVGGLADLPTRGLVEDSITATLRAEDVRGTGGDQWISVEPLTAEDAELLGRETGALFLRAVRTTTDDTGGLVEHVVSLLDPARFRFHLTFGDRS